MKKMIYIGCTLSVMALTGCVSTKVVQQELKLCPQYFQDNVGEAKILPIWSVVIPLIGGPHGWLNKDGSYTLTALASRDVILHEAFHSFDFKCWKERRTEHDDFRMSWGGSPKPQLGLYLILPFIEPVLCVPLVRKLPIPGYVNLYGLCNGNEDAAETFVFYVRDKKRNDKKVMNKRDIIKWLVNGSKSTSHLIESGIIEAEDPGIL